MTVGMACSIASIENKALENEDLSTKHSKNQKHFILCLYMYHADT